MSATGEPYLSLVVTARNDNHGGDLLGRMQAFTSGWIEQARRFHISSELIIVEWNPPADRPPLADALAWPDDFGPCTVRIVQVPREIHDRFGHADALPLYQMIAKNVGIRRARGQFILATNIDILFSNELACFFAEQRLKLHRMYRIDRHDAMGDIPASGIEEQLEYCRRHLIRINTREGTFSVKPDGRPTLCSQDVAAAGSGLLFGRGWMPVERYIANQPFRWVGSRAELLIDAAPSGVSGLLLEIEPGPGTAGAPLHLEILDDRNRMRARVAISSRSHLHLPLESPLPSKLWFCVHAGVPAPCDQRVLNFRLFRAEWLRQSSDGPATVEPIGGKNVVLAMWDALQHVINRLARGGPLVTLTVPVSPRLRGILRAYLDWNGLPGIVRQALPSWKRRRRFRRLAQPGADVFPAGWVAPGAGWKPLEEYRGEAFRRAADGAELIVSSSAPEGELGLQVEGDAAEVCLLDAAGNCLSKQRAEGVAFLHFTVPRTADRTEVFRLAIRDASGAESEAKVFWCGWTGANAASSSRTPLAQPWGAGWQWDAETASMTSSGRAELIVHASAKARPLFFDVESEGCVHLALHDRSGERIASISSRGRELHRLDVALEPGRTHVLELSASGPIRAYRCDWNESGSPAGPSGPPFLHTNGCGDFTLMAREHWFDLRGYPEFDLFSMNIDSVFCFAAHHGGAHEEMLIEPMRIYHLEHGSGSGWTPEGQAQLFERIAAKGLSFVDNEEVLAWASQMSKLKAPMIFNLADWGMKHVELKETVLPGRIRQ